MHSVRWLLLVLFAFVPALLMHCTQKEPPEYDTLILNGMIYNGSGSPPFYGDIGILHDSIAAIGNLKHAKSKKIIDAGGLAVSPGFINMNSMASLSLMLDGRAMSDIKQGVTLEIFGEGWSPGPVKRKTQSESDSLWTTLGGFFDYMMKRGVSPNIASFVGHTSVRNFVLGFANRRPDSTEIEQMKQLVREAMQQGALGLSSSLIYPPASYAEPEELIALAKVAAEYHGIYITHMRSESDFIYDALQETFRVAREASIPTEIYHLKINHARNWNKLDSVLAKIERAQRAGLKITANMYPYAASNTSLQERIPDWVQEGGGSTMRKRLKNPAIRNKVLHEMAAGIPIKNSEPEDVLILGFRLDSLNKLYQGKRLDEVARMHGKNADETVLDLIVADKSPAAAVYFLQSESNVRRILQLPYVSFGSDGASLDTTALFKNWNTHPRAFGAFARVLGKYTRDEKLISLQEAVRRMTSLPASNLKLTRRGQLQPGFFADIAIFDPDKVHDPASYENPKQLATGMVHVLVNGVPVLNNGIPTPARPGRVIKR
ncbi:MAG: D-aminoacylase [Flammeovirgaceae bacterium]|nr:MAG: D-aminoacylase [Flammeovirgaceae bacterium]